MKSLPLFTCTALLATSLAAGSFHDHLGLQMWSLRDTTKESTPKALDTAAGFGFTEIETAGTGSLSVADFTKELAARRLTVVAAHVGYEGMLKDPAKILADAKALGAKYAIIPSLPRPKTGFTAADAHRVAAEFNTWARAAKAEGLQFGYHTHGFEFVAAPDGTTPFDILVRETDPGLVVFEMDVFWVFHAGQDPLKLLAKYPGRWRLMHVKDIRKGAVTGLSTGGAPPTDKVAVGDGQIDWRVLLGAADKAGVEYYFIEDEGVQPLKDIPASIAYLKSLPR
jgi:sugar phosphate isomerase/epimerase